MPSWSFPVGQRVQDITRSQLTTTAIDRSTSPYLRTRNWNLVWSWELEYKNAGWSFQWGASTGHTGPTAELTHGRIAEIDIAVFRPRDWNLVCHELAVTGSPAGASSGARVETFRSRVLSYKSQQAQRRACSRALDQVKL